MRRLRLQAQVEQQLLNSVSGKKASGIFFCFFFPSESTDEKPNICILFNYSKNKAGSQPGVMQNMSSPDKLYFSKVDTPGVRGRRWQFAQPASRRAEGDWSVFVYNVCKCGATL